MANKAAVTVSKNFAKNLDLLRQGIKEAAHKALDKAMRQAADDARTLADWRGPGEHTATGKSGTWTWTNTGMTAASITGFVVSEVGSSRRLKQRGPRTTQIINVSSHGLRIYEHTHVTDPGLVSTPTPTPGKVRGVLTMYTAYAPYLQRIEQQGGALTPPAGGAPSAGEPVLIEVLAVNWETYYCPRIIGPEIATYMARVKAQLK